MLIWNSINLLEKDEQHNEKFKNLFTNVSDWGGGTSFENYYMAFTQSSDTNLRKFNIQVRELYALVVVVLTFSYFWMRRKYIIQTDNTANIFAVKKRACENLLVMELICILIAIQIKGNFSVKLVHICTHLNTMADLLSQRHIKAVQTSLPFHIQLQPVFPEDFFQLTQASIITN